MPCLWVHRFISAMIKTAPLVLRLSVSPELLEQYFCSHILSRSHTNYLQSSEPITYEIYLVTPNVKCYQRIAHLWHVLCAGICCLLPLFLELFPYQLILFFILCNLKEKKKKIMEIFVIKALLHMAVKIPAQIRVFLLLEQQGQLAKIRDFSQQLLFCPITKLWHPVLQIVNVLSSWKSDTPFSSWLRYPNAFFFSVPHSPQPPPTDP